MMMISSRLYFIMSLLVLVSFSDLVAANLSRGKAQALRHRGSTVFHSSHKRPAVELTPRDNTPAPPSRRSCTKKPTSVPVSSSTAAAHSSSASPKGVVDAGSAPSNSSSSSPPPSSGGSRLDTIKNMYAYEGFVYAISPCPSLSKMTSDFKAMKKVGARTVMTFDYCQGMFDNLLTAASTAGLNIIPLIWTLSTNINSNTQEVLAAVKKNPDPVLAIALGDEPMYDNDFGSTSKLASAINSIKGQLSSAGLSDIPVSISEMPFAWQQNGGASDVADAVDFFILNELPYFAGGATTGGSSAAWNGLKNDVSYIKGIAKGKPILIGQTGWPSNPGEWQATSKSAVASTSSEQAYWNLLDSHCGDYFKENNIGWMWRDWDDAITGWGVLDGSGNAKFDINAKTTC